MEKTLKILTGTIWGDDWRVVWRNRLITLSITLLPTILLAYLAA
jgi:hypothetical protein